MMKIPMKKIDFLYLDTAINLEFYLSVIVKKTQAISLESYQLAKLQQKSASYTKVKHHEKRIWSIQNEIT